MVLSSRPVTAAHRARPLRAFPTIQILTVSECGRDGGDNRAAVALRGGVRARSLAAGHTGQGGDPRS